MPAKIILNPYSNRWGAGKRAGDVERILRDLGYDFELVITSAPEQAIDLAAQAVEAGFDPVVAAGGDGAISEVINGLLAGKAQSPVRLGILPLGSANDYAFQLGIPTDLEAACKNLVAAEHVLTLDAGRINDRFIMNDVTIAIGARVNIEAAKIKRLRGSMLYLAGAFKAIASYRSPTATIAWDDGRVENHITPLAYVGNGWRTGGVFHLTPEARLNDGLLDFIFADALSRPQIVRLLPKTFNGSHIHDARVHSGRCTWLRFTSPDPIPVLADGEIIYRDAHELDIRILPQALRVIAGESEGMRVMPAR
ncbi:MAG: diacylglycerol kinase family lipid kinase [Caldilineales bacterium]|nr:diacylglycerol kinase family lipid kinase [Caldilineales bacterium]